jgi:hypothetical protein
MDSGLLNVTFNEPVDITTFDARGVTLQMVQVGREGPPGRGTAHLMTWCCREIGAMLCLDGR